MSTPPKGDTSSCHSAEGRAEGTELASLRSIRNLMRSMKLTAQQAMSALGVPSEEQARYAEKLGSSRKTEG